MRELASCLSDHAVQVSDTSCSSYKNIKPCIISAPSIQNSVTCLYRSTLKQMTMTLTWSRTASSHALTISFDDDPSVTFKIASNNSRLFRKSKGSKSLHLRSSSSKIDLFWDLSAARYHPGPEPLDGFYLAVVVDSALALLLGDKAAPHPHQFGASADNKLALVSRQEHLSGSAVYSTRARFSEGGGAHDVSIRYGEMERNPILWVCVDKKTVMKVRKVQWNFRGNHTIFVDGMLVDLLWDVHDWFYNPDSGCAVFMFKPRSTGLDSTTFWMHDNDNSPPHHRRHLDFSFMICACKN
ncbi:uncharacterized protein LOC125212988 [Salvia hispanica]|uniref:uncharacterized protein LOC125212988 n=1 Tax=Salvia hispanica TaxID=49212 RepID=UPI0020090D8C|nr:uncharacterized protein LOC125212988 [Salvia hispanica]